MTESSTTDRIQQLLSQERRDRLDTHRILSLIPLRPYFTVADVGCGPGLFTIPLAKSLWDGKVYALDTDEKMLEAVVQRAQQARLGNIVTVKSEEAVLPLEPGILDGALLACVLHAVSDRPALLRAVVGALKHSGWCGVIEWRKTSGSDEGPPPERRIAEEEVVELAKEVGMRVTLRRELNNYLYLLLLNK